MQSCGGVKELMLLLKSLVTQAFLTKSVIGASLAGVLGHCCGGS